MQTLFFAGVGQHTTSIMRLLQTLLAGMGIALVAYISCWHGTLRYCIGKGAKVRARQAEQQQQQQQQKPAQSCSYTSSPREEGAGKIIFGALAGISGFGDHVPLGGVKVVELGCNSAPNVHPNRLNGWFL